MQERLIIGTRGSKLALTQTNWVRERILDANPGLQPDDIVIETIVTTGDRVTDRKLQDIGGKGLFTKEIEDGLTASRLHLAVHSMKDMPTRLPEGLTLALSPKREDPRDVLISHKASHIDDLPDGARVGTASLRRAAQLLARRPDLRIEMLRGNVDTRLRKLDEGVVDAIILAKAGLNRLGFQLDHAHSIPADIMLPAVGQGALALEVREGDSGTLASLAPLGDKDTSHAVQAERAFLGQLDGDCRTPLAAHAVVEGESLTLIAEIYSADGSQRFRAEASGHPDMAQAIGERAAEDIKRQAGADFIAGLKGQG